ncbi:Hypothetical predicted protein [Lecanosticta acicola]|uniref:Uncharacterized protein n=1 Tax=Lecanosticta acicola TaxID=111012 RepID=A0AAI8Z4N5_9PEZI|nr:Hypothetical predicted protein [Lecanosticta acicola]
MGSKQQRSAGLGASQHLEKFMEDSTSTTSHSDNGVEGDGQIRLPLDDLLQESGISTDPPEPFVSQMGDHSTMRHSTLQHASGPRKGKLKRPSSRGPAQDPSKRAKGPGRTLGRVQARPDAYELEASPDKPILEPIRRLQGHTDFSPIRAQRRAQETAQEHPGGTRSRAKPTRLQATNDETTSQPAQSSAQHSPQGSQTHEGLFVSPEPEQTESDQIRSQRPSVSESPGPGGDQDADKIHVEVPGDHNTAQVEHIEQAERTQDRIEPPVEAGAERAARSKRGKLFPVLSNARIQKVRQSEMWDRSKEDNIEEEAQETPIPKPLPSRKIQKQRALDRTKHIQTRPARGSEIAPEAPVDGPEPSVLDASEMPEHQASDGRLLGQMATIKILVRATRKVGISIKDGVEDIHNPVALRDPQVRNILELCRRASRKFTQLVNDPESSQTSDPPEELELVVRETHKLCGNDRNNMPNFEDPDTSSNIYAHLIPRLIRLLRRMSECYVAIDEGKVAAEISVTSDHLENLIGLIDLIVEMGAAARKYVRPDSSFAIVNSVKLGLLKPLKSVKAIFQGHLRRVDEEQQRARRRALDEEAEARRQVDEEEEEAQKARVKALRGEWERLHGERWGAEGYVLPKSKQNHLRVPKPTPEVDPNGEEFERVVGLFGHRVGPLPALVDEARRQAWTEEEVMALCYGLRAYQGPRVFQNIFRQFCGRKGVLNKYNVTQIVTVAADIKEDETRSQLERQGFVEDWVKAIPVWTNPHTLLGKENVDGGEGEV